MSEPVKVVVVVKGGCVQSVIAREFVEAVVVDYDSIEQGDPPPEDMAFQDGTNVADFMKWTTRRT